MKTEKIVIEERHNFNIKETISPEGLAVLREFFRNNEQLNAIFPKIYQVSLILDANVIISDILWLAKKQKNPDARPRLLLALMCGTIKAYFPFFLIEELDKNLPKLAKEHNIPYEVLQSKWLEFKQYIELVDVDDPTDEEISAAQDSKDLPYIKLQEKIGAQIHSNDSDIIAMVVNPFWVCHEDCVNSVC